MPTRFVFSRDGRFVYRRNELDATLDVLAPDADAGTPRSVRTHVLLPRGGLSLLCHTQNV